MATAEICQILSLLFDRFILQNIRQHRERERVDPHLELVQSNSEHLLMPQHCLSKLVSSGSRQRIGLPPAVHFLINQSPSHLISTLKTKHMFFSLHILTLSSISDGSSTFLTQLMVSLDVVFVILSFIVNTSTVICDLWVLLKDECLSMHSQLVLLEQWRVWLVCMWTCVCVRKRESVVHLNQFGKLWTQSHVVHSL